MNFIVPLIVYPFDIMFSIGDTDKQLRKVLKKRLPKEEFDMCVEDECLLKFGGMDKGRTVMLITGGQTIVRLGKQPSYAVVAHEIFHCVEFLFRRLNMPLTLDNDEAYAYLIGYITEMFYKQEK